MAEEALRATNSTGTVKSRSLLRRNSLPLFPSDLGKDVPGYLRASTGSCHDYCKYGRKETPEVKQTRPGIKRPLAVPGIKASDKPKSRQDDSFKMRKPPILPEDKTPEASSKQGVPREKDTKIPECFPKSVKSKLLKEKSMTRKSPPTSGHEKHKMQKERVPESGNSRAAKTNSKSTEGGKLTKPVKGLAPDAAVKQNAKVKQPSSSPTPLEMATRLKPLSSSSPHRARPMTIARPHSSPTKLKPASLMVNSSSATGSLKLKHATVKTSPPSIPPRSVSSKKTIDIRSQIVTKGKSSKVQATEAVAARCSSVSPNLEVAANSEKKELELVDAEYAEKKELFERNEESSHEIVLATEAVTTRCDSVSPDSDVVANSDTGELQQVNLVGAETSENKDLFEKNEEDPGRETDLQNQELTESYDDEVPEKTLYIIKVETENVNQQASNAEEDIPEMQPLASLSPPRSLNSPGSVTVSHMTTQTDISPNELRNMDTALPCADQETPDMQPLPSLSPAISPKSQSSITASNELSHYEVSLDGSMYTESEEGYSSYEDERLIEGENLKGDADNIKVKRSARVISQDNGQDPVKLRFRRGRVIEITHENRGPRRLKFRRAKVLDEKAAKDFARKSSFKITEATRVNATSDDSAGTVVLRHQDMQDKKDAQGLLNNVIEETASKLVEKRKSMVKALVGAFETVILLQDGKPATTQHDQ